MIVERTPISAIRRPICPKFRVIFPSQRSVQTGHGSSATAGLGFTAAPGHQRQPRTSFRRAPCTSITQIRYATTSPTTASTATTPTSSATAPTLTWNQFLRLRKTRRRYNLIASVSTGLGTAFAGFSYLATMDLTQLGQLIFGIDPIMALGISTVGAGALGWLLGPFAGNAVFSLIHRSARPEMMAKEKDFYHRIRRHRADITAGGNLQNNPFPDYYGEKIDSVKGYRQWLRDQRKFSKKRQYREA